MTNTVESTQITRFGTLRSRVESVAHRLGKGIEGRIFPSSEYNPARRKSATDILVLSGAIAVGLSGLAAMIPDSAEAAGTGPTPSSTPIPRREPVSTATTSVPDLVKNTKQTPEVTKTPTPEAMTAGKALEQIGISSNETRLGEGTFGTSDALVALTTVSQVGGKKLDPTLVVVNGTHVLGLRLSNNGTQSKKEADTEHPFVALKVSSVVNNSRVIVVPPGDKRYKGVDTSHDGVRITRSPKGDQYLVTLSYTTAPSGTSPTRVRPDDYLPYTVTVALPADESSIGIEGLTQVISQMLNGPDWSYAYEVKDAFQRVIGDFPSSTK